jgi:hypothetical protein
MRQLALVLLMLAILALAVLHILFGIANFYPGFSKIEGVAAMLGGVALIAAIPMARLSVEKALLTACVGTVPLSLWFAYAVPVEGSSGPQFFWVSLIVPVSTGLVALAMRRRRKLQSRS